MIDMASTGLRRSSRLANKPRQKYGLFSKLSWAVIGACEVSNNLHIFIAIANQHNQDINRHFDGTLNKNFPVVFATNKSIKLILHL